MAASDAMEDKVTLAILTPQAKRPTLKYFKFYQVRQLQFLTNPVW